MSPTRLALTTLVALLLLAPAASARIAYTTAKGMNAAGAPIVIANDNGNDMRRKAVSVAPRGYKTVNIEKSSSHGVGFQFIEDPEHDV